MGHNFTLPKKYLSASAIKTFLGCPRQYMYRYVEGIISPPSAAAFTGKVGHKVLETHYTDIMDGRTPLPADKAADFSVACLERMLQDEEQEIQDFDKDTVIGEVRNSSSAYVEHVAPGIVPRGVEVEFRYETACGVELLAYVDLIREPKDSERAVDITQNVVCDYKFTNKKWSIGQLRDNLQFMVYSAVTGIRNMEIQNVVKTTKAHKARKAPEDADLLAKHDPTSHIRMLRHQFPAGVDVFVDSLVERVASAISTGVFAPCDPESWRCSPKWCGYWDKCRGEDLAGNTRYIIL